VPTFHRLGVQIGERFDVAVMLPTVCEVLIQYGLALCLFSAAAAAEFARLRTRAA
jgi:hypothetical protein